MDLQKTIDQAKYVVFLTGAGVSTPSGIPDYRSKNGLYTNSGHQTPEYLLSHDNLTQHPDDFYQFVLENMYFPDAQPNIIHQKMAEITNEKGMVITQNVDCLHTKAGTKNLVEFHGNLYDIHCQTCGESVDYREYLQNYHHQKDNGILRSGVVLYGESIPQQVLEQSVTAISQADLIVIVGTSFRVYPFANLLQYRADAAQVLAINKEDIGAASGVEMVVADAVKVFSKLK